MKLFNLKRTSIFMLISLSMVALVLFFVQKVNSQLERQMFISGKLKRPNDGLFKEYYANGELYSVEYYSDGLKTGTWKYYHPNGKLLKTIPYKNGQVSGNIHHFSPSGPLTHIEYYADGQFVNTHVTNDSLYAYEVALESHGKNLFINSCEACHSQSDSELGKSMSFIRQHLDSTGIGLIALDSLHGFHFATTDSIRLEEYDGIGPRNTKFFEKYDIEAIIDYLKTEEQRPGSRVKMWPYKIRKNVVLVD